MAAKLTVVLALALFVSSAFAWESIQAGHKESCTDKLCDEAKNLVCSMKQVCECKVDEESYIPWGYVSELDKCIPVRQEDFAQAPYALAQSHGGNSGGSGSQHGHNAANSNGIVSFAMVFIGLIALRM